MNTYGDSCAARIGAVSLTVSNLERSTAFYCNTLGFSRLRKRDHTVLLTGDRQFAIVHLIESPHANRRTANSPGIDHFAILLPSRRDLARAVRHIISSGRRIMEAIDHYVCESVYFADPDGITIELSADRPRSMWPYRANHVEFGSGPLAISSLVSEPGALDEAWDGLPSATRVGHAEINVTDIVAAMEFYTGLLGFDLCARAPGTAILATGGYHHHIRLTGCRADMHPPDYSDLVGVRSITIDFALQDMRNKAIRRLRDAEFPVVETNGRAMTSDPSGLPIELALQQASPND